MYSKYNISDTLRFSILDFPKVELELLIMKNAITAVPNDFKDLMIISFIKDHSLKTEWVAANPDLAKLLNSNSFSTTQSHSLFESSKRNTVFSTAFEAHIRDKIISSFYL